ncbi:MAG: proline--tRNA ligase [Bacilli bacterium]
MRLSEQFFYTIREDIKDEETVSGNLLVKSGMVKKVSNGIYMYMPLGLMVLRNIEKIIREEMDNTGASELLMPNLLPEDVYINSGRRNNFGHDMFSLKDRFNRSLVLGPTHEEFFVEAAKMKIKSYKDMPFNIYQIGNKYRDEPRPRFGLIRVREFFMKDAYSFDKDIEALDVSYAKMFQAYKKIFDKIGLNYRIVTADTGVMGGLLSEEFQAISDIGEDVLVLCKCGYASNIEVSKCVIHKEKEEKLKDKILVHTPNCKKIKEVATYLDEDINKFVKTLIYNIDDKLYACLVSGNRDINETKLRKLLDAKNVMLASEEDVIKVTKAEVGFAGPIGLDITIIIDNDLLYKYNYIVGANKTDYHYKNVNTKDFEYQYIGDIKNVLEDDTCPLCGKKLSFAHGIEVGNTFKLGTKYSKALDLNYLDEHNLLQPVVMGCYGIGLGRIMASIAQQNNDENGLIWPSIIAPFKVGIILINKEDDKQRSIANALYNEIKRNNITVMLDDRDERPGVKFNDIDLIGIPYRITVGKKVVNDLVELKIRKTNEVIDIHVNDIVKKINELGL